MLSEVNVELGNPQIALSTSATDLVLNVGGPAVVIGTVEMIVVTVPVPSAVVIAVGGAPVQGPPALLCVQQNITVDQAIPDGITCITHNPTWDADLTLEGSAILLVL